MEYKTKGVCSQMIQEMLHLQVDAMETCREFPISLKEWT